MYNRWLEAFDKCREDKSYFKIRRMISEEGFLAPVASKVGHNNDYIVVADGHHRITVAYDLDLEAVPVYIGDRRQRLDDLVAIE